MGTYYPQFFILIIITLQKAQIYFIQLKGCEGMKKNILISVGGIIAITFIIKGIGFVKQVMIAGYFGSSMETDIFFLASELVANLLYAFTASLSTVLLPAFRGKIETNLNSGLSDFISRILTFFIPISLLVTTIFIIAAPLLSVIVASTYDHHSLTILTKYLRLIAPTLIFALIATVFTAVLNAHRDYFIPKLASTMISIVPIVFIFLFYKQFGIRTLVLALPAAYFFQAIFMYIFVKKNNLFLRLLNRIKKLKPYAY